MTRRQTTRSFRFLPFRVSPAKRLAWITEQAFFSLHWTLLLGMLESRQPVTWQMDHPGGDLEGVPAKFLPSLLVDVTVSPLP